jgi:hypothetical protein
MRAIAMDWVASSDREQSEETGEWIEKMWAAIGMRGKRRVKIE